jgi:hypothetical protein
VFESYTQQVLCTLLRERLLDLANPKALELISRRVAAHAGDARMALEFAADALKRGHRDWEQKNVSWRVFVLGEYSYGVQCPDKEYLLEMGHAMAATKSVGATGARLAEFVKNSSPQIRMTLVACLTVLPDLNRSSNAV